MRCPCCKPGPPISSIASSPARPIGSSATTAAKPAKSAAKQRPAEYVARLTAIFRECRRVMKKTGTLWLVIGDKYDDGAAARPALARRAWPSSTTAGSCGPIASGTSPTPCPARPNRAPPPTTNTSSSSRNRRTTTTTPTPSASRTSPSATSSRMRGGRRHFGIRGGTPEAGKNGGSNNLHDGRWDQAFHPLGRNKRTVWSIPLSKFRDAHFAVFPESLVETCILAGCPAGGLVLDPFVGSGTVPLVARRLESRLSRHRLRRRLLPNGPP